jgi:hypothetical protein
LLRRFDHVPGFIFTGKKKNNLIQKKRAGNFGSERQKGDGKMKKSLYVSAVAFVAMVFLCCPQKGLADLVTVHFVGEVTGIVSSSNQYSWETEVYFKAGDPFKGSYRYQSDQQSFGNGDPAKSGTLSKYRIEAIKFSVGNVSGFADGGVLFVYDNYGAPPNEPLKDEYGFYVPRNNPITTNEYPHTPISFGLDMYDSTATAIDTSALPLTVPDLLKFPSARLELLFGQGLFADGLNYAATLEVSGKVTALEQKAPIATPVPASLLLLGSGLIGLAGRRLRRTNQ